MKPQINDLLLNVSVFFISIYHEPKDYIFYTFTAWKKQLEMFLLFIYENIFMVMENELNLN